VRDVHDFQNSDPPRRGIRSVPLDPPQVALLPELFRYRDDRGSPEDYEVEGMPVPLGRKIRIGYYSTAPYGLSRAQLCYRVLPSQMEGEQVPEEDLPWIRHPLTRVTAGPATGPFDLQRGLFVASGEDDQVEFHTVPSADPDRVSGIEGGGRLDFQTRGIPDAKGGLLDLKVGDRIEYCVEVFDRIPDPDRPPSRSEVRMKTVVSVADWLAWKREKERQEERLNQLEAKQRAVFAATSPPPDEDRPGPARANVSLPRTIERPRPPVAPPGTLAFGRSWLLLGPFPNPEDRGHAMVFPPETDYVYPEREYDGLKGKTRWQVHHSDTDKIDLEKFFSHGEAGVAYAACWFRCGHKRVVLGTGSDDGIKVWINGKVVVDKPVHREAVAGDDKTSVDLRDGWNALLVKVDNTFGTWAFFLDLRDVNSGRLLDRVDVRLTPIDEDYHDFVRDWLLVGPFTNTDGEGFDKAYPPEQDPVDLKKEFDGRKGKVRWRRYSSNTDKIDFLKAFSPPFEDSPGVAYAVCWMHCDQPDHPATLAMGSHDGIKVWLNRRLVHSKKAQREIVPGTDHAKVTLAKGWNEILVKIDNKAGHWGFCLEVRDAGNTRPLIDMGFRLEPPDDSTNK
jgi:hypothetical protein